MAMGAWQNSRCGHTGSCSGRPAHRQLRAYGCSLLDRRSSGVRQPPGCLSNPIEESLCSPSWPEERARIDALKIACFILPCPAYRGGRGSHLCGLNIKMKTKMTSLTIGTWNVRMLMDSTKADSPERRTALVGRELDRYNIHIAGLSEIKFANEGQLTEVKAGYTFFWNGHSSEERRKARERFFCVRSSFVSKFTDLLKAINDRLMTDPSAPYPRKTLRHLY